MTGSQLEALVRDELRRSRLHLQFEVKRAPTGLFILLWSDWTWCDGIGGRRVFGHDDTVRHREASIAVLTLHSRVPRISYGGGDDGKPVIDLWTPPRCPEPVVRALVTHAIAQSALTRRRLREARRRLREAGVRVSQFRQKPAYSHRTG